MKYLLNLLVLIPLVVSNSALAGSWEIEVIDSEGDVGGNTSIALDSSDAPHISYLDFTNGNLKYAYNDGSGWDIETVDSEGGFYDDTSIAVDSYGNPHIAYVDCTNKFVKYAYKNDDSWYMEFIDDTSCFHDCASIALDSIDYPHISYHDVYKEDLRYAHWDGSGWELESVDTDDDVGFYSSVAVDSFDLPCIAYDYNEYDKGYRDDIDEIRYAHWNGSEWEFEVIESPYFGIGISLAIDSDDYPHISYQNYGLKYAHWDGSDWVTEGVDPGAITGSYSSIAVDSNDYPHISYYDGGDDDDLKYARWTGFGWHIEIVDSESDVGKFTSITVDSDDCPHISYHDWDNGDLKYARYVSGIGIELNAFSAKGIANGIEISWECEGTDLYAFNLYRAEGPVDSVSKRERINDRLITGAPPYRFVDDQVTEGATYGYWLEVIDAGGGSDTYGPVYCEWSGSLPTGYALYQSRPNPTTGVATVTFELPEEAEITLTVYDLAGRQVYTLVDGTLPAGTYERKVSGLTTGVYIYRLESEEFSTAKKLVVIR